MKLTASVEVDAEAPAVMSVVTDLATYPQWLDIVGNVRTDEQHDDDPGPAWFVDLRAQLGPLRRSKRLRMVQTVSDEHAVQFERRELDGRSHSPWLLAADLVTVGDARTQVTMRLDYGGSMWLPLLDRLLAEEIRRARPRLKAVLEAAG